MAADNPIWVTDLNAQGSGKTASSSPCCAASWRICEANRVVVPVFGAGDRRHVPAMGEPDRIWPAGIAR